MAIAKMTKVIMKYESIGLVDIVLSVTKLEVLGTIELRLIQFNPAKNKTENKETNSMLIVLLTDSS
jgi:hypothetical protein